RCGGGRVQFGFEPASQRRVGERVRFPQEQRERAENSLSRMPPRTRVRAKPETIGAQVEDKIADSRPTRRFIPRVPGIRARRGKGAFETARLQDQPALLPEGGDFAAKGDERI